DWVIGGVGSRLTKHFISVDLVAPGAESKISGLYFVDGEQHLSYNTQQNHLSPRTYSDLLFKGALTGAGRSVWRGMIYVAPDARHTDGYQANRNLLLNADARADSIPGLEILNDEVRCSHGATVGKIDPEQLFYLQARGVPLPEAERLIVYGFFDDILRRIPLASVKEKFTQTIHQKLDY
ncbi:MAG: SufD family Fe-S cluster assembly protein, partial [Chloroflexota bacterium]|nr:SufD family Fe-S cluster assembly protein [Chloroflexota bacterium]